MIYTHRKVVLHDHSNNVVQSSNGISEVSQLLTCVGGTEKLGAGLLFSANKDNYIKMAFRTALRLYGPIFNPRHTIATRSEFTSTARRKLSTLLPRDPIAAATKTDVVALEQKIGYTFRDKDVAKEALQLAGDGVLRIGGRELPNGNKRLAVVGDGVLDMVL